MWLHGRARTVDCVNLQPFIVESALDARRADLVREADAARLAARPRRRRSFAWLRARLETGGSGRIRGFLNPRRNPC
jgi:uncharacterized membrane-anchored protein